MNEANLERKFTVPTKQTQCNGFCVRTEFKEKQQQQQKHVLVVPVV